MSKKKNNLNSQVAQIKAENRKQAKQAAQQQGPECLLLMKNSSGVNKPSSLLFMLPIIIYSAFVILIVRMHIYTRPMGQFFWTPQTDETQLTDFFSYDKMIVILVMSCVALAFVLLRVAYSDYAIKKTILYIPMAVFAAFAILSYICSDYKEFSLLGYNDRFEGLIPLLCYMFMLFYIINSVNTEKNVKQIIWPLAVTSVCLSLLGLTQGIDHDFFRSELGQKLICANYTLSDGTTVWDNISQAFARGEQYFNFTFQNKEIYQTVYNINYVSFYLTLLLPLWAMLFVRTVKAGAEEPLWKKIALGVVFALNVYNFIGSVSSGGVIGVVAIIILIIVIFNKKLLKVWKPIAVLVVVTAIILGLTTDKWVSEIKGTFSGIFGSSSTVTAEVDSAEATDAEVEAGSVRPWIDYLRTSTEAVTISVNGNELNFVLGDDYLQLTDGEGNGVEAVATDEGIYTINDERYYKYMTLAIQQDENENTYLILDVAGTQLPFTFDGYQFMYLNGYGNLVALTEDVDHDSFFNKHMNFGSSRGYIWSRSIPMLKDNLIVGTGPDTYCVSFPQGDYAGRYNEGSSSWMTIIIDKPHNMYLNTGICTGCISLLAIIALYGIYVVQSFKLFWKRDLGTDLLNYAGIGIFLGTTGFMLTGLVNDSSVSVMPMFYTLLGTGIAINLIIRSRDKI